MHRLPTIPCECAPCTILSVVESSAGRGETIATRPTGRCSRRPRHTLFTIFAASNSSFGIFVDWFKIKHENIWLVAFIIRLGCFLRICSLNVKINNMFSGCNWVGCGINGGANNALWDELGDITSFKFIYLLLTYVSLIILFVYCIVLYLEKILYLYFYCYSLNLIF